jgi:hypothetical protein
MKKEGERVRKQEGEIPPNPPTYGLQLEHAQHTHRAEIIIVMVFLLPPNISRLNAGTRLSLKRAPTYARDVEFWSLNLFNSDNYTLDSFP